MVIYLVRRCVGSVWTPKRTETELGQKSGVNNTNFPGIAYL